MINILLIGIDGVYNYGCEAIVRGTVTILKAKYPDSRIVYASRRPSDDKIRLQGCTVEIIDASLKKWTLKNVIRKLLSLLNIKFSYIQENKSILKGIDEVYSIGGDIYTLDAQSDFSKYLPLFGEYCMSIGIKYFLYGCSVGPFEKNPKALSFFKKHLKRITKIYARENNTVEYLKTIGVKLNVELIKDPAFFVATEITRTHYNDKIKIVGINLSPLSARYFFTSLEKSVSYYVNWLVYLIESLNCEIKLLPHVISDSLGDDDFRYLNEIHDNIPEYYRDKVILIDSDPGFIGLKNEIIKCDIIVAARMHCAINSFVTKTPVVFLSYSSKSLGMAKQLYGDTKYVFNLNQVNSKEFLDSLINAHERIFS